MLKCNVIKRKIVDIVLQYIKYVIHNRKILNEIKKPKEKQNNE